MRSTAGATRQPEIRSQPLVSDVFAGAAIGYFTARFLIRLHKNSQFAILPLLENGRQGLALAYRF